VYFEFLVRLKGPPEIFSSSRKTNRPSCCWMSFLCAN